MSDGLAIDCQGLVKRFSDVTAVSGLDLDVRLGECFGLLGPNGAGKTTTIEILEGLQEPDAGSVRVLGSSWQEHPDRLRQRIGLSLQETLFHEKWTVIETLRLFRSVYRMGPDPDELLAEVELEEKSQSRVGKLSGGQRQRLAVACALAGEPELLFLDEPTTGLDPQSRLRLWDQIARFRKKGGTVLLTTHYMDEAERLCDRVAVVDHGKVIALGTPAELISTLPGANVVEVASDPPLPEEKLREVSGVRDVQQRGDSSAMVVGSLAESVPPILAAIEAHGSRLVTLTTHRATLEDVFVHLTGRHLRDV
jgi:ABC-2 type transport system ATP-binding protein